MEHRLLDVQDFHVSYGQVEAVTGVSFYVKKGSIVTVIGPNGAGKSTLMNSLMGLLPYKGDAYFKGINLSPIPTERRLITGLCLIAEKRELFSEMTVEDNLQLGAYSRTDTQNIKHDIEWNYELFPRLKERRKQLAGTLSGGERQMLAISRALMSRPELLMLDEPSLGLAPLIVAEVLQTIANLRQQGVSILIVEQNAKAALQIADYGYVMENGNIVLEGVSKELLSNNKLIEAYLGSSHNG